MSALLLPLLVLGATSLTLDGGADSWPEADRFEIPDAGPAADSGSAGESAGEVKTRADRLFYEPDTHHTHYSGDVQLSHHGITLRADELDYDPLAHRARATGNVVLVEGLLGAGALSVDLDLLSDVGRFEGATLYEKRAVSPAALAAARSLSELRALGRNSLTLHADVVQKIADDEFRAEGLWISPCDCRDPGGCEETPSWSVRASKADLRPGDRALLTWALVYIDGVPVLPLPVMFLPLGDRRTGFLLPRPNFTARNGFQIEEPFFWAINGWSDATITPGYFFGRDDSSAAQTIPGAEQPGMKGPRLDLELRYVPSTDTVGRFTGALVEDLKSIDPNGSGSPRGLRGELGWTHAQSLGSGWDDRVDLGLISDESYFRDVTADLVASQAQYLRSSARLDRRTDDTDLTLSGSYFQNLVIPGCTPVAAGAPAADLPFGQVPCTGAPHQFDPTRSLGPYLGPHDINADTFQRLPDLAFDFEESRLGPVVLSLESDIVRFGSISPSDPLVAQVDPVAAQRSTDYRLDVAPKARLPLLLGGVVEVAPYVQVREDGWLIEDQTAAQRTYALVGVTSEADIARSWKDRDETWRNVLTPSLELRSIPWQSGSGPAVANDDIDGALDGPTDSHLLQGIASLRTRFDRRQGSKFTEPLRIEIGQGMDLAHARLADSYATAAGQLGLLQLTATGRYDPLGWDGHHPRLAALNSRLAAVWPSGSSVYGQYELLDPNQTDPMRASLVDLIGPEAAAPVAGDYLAEEVVLGVKGVARSAWTGYAEATFLPHATQQPELIDRFLAYRIGGGYNSPCNCWGVTVVANFSPIYEGSPWTPLSFMVVLDAQRIEGF